MVYSWINPTPLFFFFFKKKSFWWMPFSVVLSSQKLRSPPLRMLSRTVEGSPIKSLEKVQMHTCPVAGISCFLISTFQIECFDPRKNKVMISIQPTRQVSICGRHLNVVVFLDTINMVNVNLHNGSAHWALPIHTTFKYFKVPAMSSSFIWHFYAFIWLSWNFA